MMTPLSSKCSEFSPLSLDSVDIVNGIPGLCHYFGYPALPPTTVRNTWFEKSRS